MFKYRHNTADNMAFPLTAKDQPALRDIAFGRFFAKKSKKPANPPGRQRRKYQERYPTY